MTNKPPPPPNPGKPPIPILVPVSPGRPGVWYPTAGRPSGKLPPTPRVETRATAQAPPPAPATPRSELKVTLRLGPPAPGSPSPDDETQILGRPAQDTPNELVPRATLDERRRRLLDLMLEIESKLEMLDDLVPF